MQIQGNSIPCKRNSRTKAEKRENWTTRRRTKSIYLMKEEDLKRKQYRSYQKTYPVIKSIPIWRWIPELALKEEKKLWLTMCYAFKDKPKGKNTSLLVYPPLKNSRIWGEVGWDATNHITSKKKKHKHQQTWQII